MMVKDFIAPQRPIPAKPKPPSGDSPSRPPREDAAHPTAVTAAPQPPCNSVGDVPAKRDAPAVFPGRVNGGYGMTAARLLKRAAGLVDSRREDYGEPDELFHAVARRWSLVLGAKVTPAQVALCLIDLNLAQLSHNPAHLDSIMDVAGYAARLAELSCPSHEIESAAGAGIAAAERLNTARAE